MWLETFWQVVTILCLVWYSILTVYVAARGGPEIVRLVQALRGHPQSCDGSSGSSEGGSIG
jgi:hypothetical protein